ncbi:hypothetical protein GUJ93_ZPchr0005g15768 [Zizania palustris]|uniref:Receptor-like serine/threonine-protein kinase n=1 Tax=Zizania palustris TaxID=103762 RepID=A0A8J5VFZ8_ZIZPA|nr:hypothetical protein GUJ93_ZPchr0005g15768 [Zizania palustris]
MPEGNTRSMTGGGATHRAAACAFIILVLAIYGVENVHAADTTAISVGRPLSGDQHRLVSPGGKFALGFFQPAGGVAGSWYVGIWYNNISVQTPVWVANRLRPVSDPATSRLAIAPDGNLVLFDGRTGSTVWSTEANITADVRNGTVAVLLDTGNLVLALASDASGSAAVLWQSFDHIGDTWLPGGKLRRDKRTGAIQGMVSWRARGDPAPGMYALQLDPDGAPQYVLLWNGTREYWITGNWTGRIFADAPEVAASSGSSGYTFKFVDNDDESYFTYNFADNSTVYRFVTDASGQVKGWFWVEATQAWNLVYAEPKARCAVPRVCGAFGVCSEGASTACDCARGFSPRIPPNWGQGDYTGGCVRNVELQCGKNSSGGGGAAAGSRKAKMDRFLEMDGMRLPDDGRVAGATSSGDCKNACLLNCSCSAYAFNGSCVLWHGDLLNLQDSLGGTAGRLYLRLAASELPGARSHSKWRITVIAVSAASIVVLVVTASVLVVRATRRRWIRARIQGLSAGDGRVISFKYRDLQSITRNFSDKLGGGAFGSVFRGELSSCTAVAVKKLEGLRQGEKQFRAEVSTLGTVQHVNLIRLLGFCSDGGDRKLLVYEYMPNGSLDRHLFRAMPPSYSLSWAARYRIALGVAKGLAYLHYKCRDCIIHCDVKPENILLDAAFAPKVADFGLAKLVGRDFSRVLTTMRGTIGYLAPEWISGEAITPKADVFSYGMTLFEIVSGRRNAEHGAFESAAAASGTDHTTTTFFPVTVARMLAESAEEGDDVTAFLDPELEGNANASELRRVCKVACWCIQDGVDARPTMAEVVQVLEGVTDVETPPVPRYLQVLAGRAMHASDTCV